MERKVGQYQIKDAQGRTFNMVDPNKKPSIFDPNSEFIRELEITKLRLETKPRKSNMMQAQIGMIQDFCSEMPVKKLYVPGASGGFVGKPLVSK